MSRSDQQGMQDKDLNELRCAQASGLTLSSHYRLNELRNLARFIRENKLGLVNSMMADFMTNFGATFELDHCLFKLEYVIDNFQSWMKNCKVSTGWSVAHFMDKVWTHYDPVGVVLIIGSWNAPLLLTLEPLMGAISAGCCSVIKPSELAYNTSKYLAQNLPKYLDGRTFRIFEGGPAETESLVESFKWDLIFYTGSEKIGRIIYQQAAKQLTPVVLELGGKCPAIVLEDLTEERLQIAADRIMSTKGLKCGQLCLSIDYILCEEKIFDKFLGCLINSAKEMYGIGQRSRDLDLLVNERHWDRLASLLDGNGGSIIYESMRDRRERYFGLTIVTNPNESSSLMQEEIFGPILPVLKTKSLEDAIKFVNSKPKPLALYAFTQNETSIGRIQKETRSGSCSFNDAVFTYVLNELPFGGVGNSGIGQYHGKYSFEVFSHRKACMNRNLRFPMLDRFFRYPPLDGTKNWRIDLLYRRLPRIIRSFTYLILFSSIFAIMLLFLGYIWSSKSK